MKAYYASPDGSVDGGNECPKTIGWALWNGSECKGFDLTKKGLLIGYDMISLCGLPACERFLATQGWIPRRTRLVISQETSGAMYGPVVHGKPSTRMAAWGALCNTAEGAFRSTAGYVYSHEADFGVTSGEAKIAGSYWFSLHADAKRKPVSHARLRSECARILEKLGISIQPISLKPASQLPLLEAAK